MNPPLVLFILGLLALIGGMWWGERQRGGMLSGFFEGVIGVAICLICWAMAGGMLLGGTAA